MRSGSATSRRPKVRPTLPVLFLYPPGLPAMKLPLLVASLLPVSVCLAASGWPEQLERDWILQAKVEAAGQIATKPSTRDDAAGGSDGVTNGKWGFHTGEQEGPWWQVDLGESMPLAQVRLWNRADNDGSAQRASRFQIHLSDDGTAWRQVYRHDGTVFYGYRMPDRSPLSVKLTNATALRAHSGARKNRPPSRRSGGHSCGRWQRGPKQTR